MAKNIPSAPAKTAVKVGNRGARARVRGVPPKSVWARRTIVVERDGKISRGCIEVTAPYLALSGSWCCDIAVRPWVPNPIAFSGKDALEATDKALRFMREVIMGATHGGARIWWRYPGDFGGVW